MVLWLKIRSKYQFSLQTDIALIASGPIATSTKTLFTILMSAYIVTASFNTTSLVILDATSVFFFLFVAADTLVVAVASASTVATVLQHTATITGFATA